MIFRTSLRPIAVAALLCATGSLLLAQKHEKTRRDKEDDRTKLIDTLSADTRRISSGTKKLCNR